MANALSYGRCILNDILCRLRFTRRLGTATAAPATIAKSSAGAVGAAAAGGKRK
ncbi:hypothetical protein M2A_1482 [Tepidicaulis marinus]|uniref:Uncharacterized protein n=1 Tax=Tepidicaulis marinus TaxID=1333998 RepID=A0A081BAB5_9HYPH|nr:hypothetical protein M2A_1482 [Tepidicaulis marinus]